MDDESASWDWQCVRYEVFPGVAELGVHLMVGAKRCKDADTAVRISKRLSELGLCSRREGDRYIAQGFVTVDGVVIKELGTKVGRHQTVQLNRQGKKQQDTRITAILNKPIGFISHADDGHFYQTATSLITPCNFFPSASSMPIPFKNGGKDMDVHGLAPAGRLDIESSGLLVLTQDGRIAKQLIGNNNQIEKEYLVRVKGSLSDSGLDALRDGSLQLDGHRLKPAKVYLQNKHQLRFVLREGKKRQLRRMCEMVGLGVTGLKRVRVGRVLLGNLPMGKWRCLRPGETF